ncbi:hypothetical protein RZN05_12375 [Sphingomonas sp. HF-S4]|uniref:Uncharacterized protein n=1 Tax=Sphingomonas agrestis TaxID=3080540 RepID=A0ABU3Y8P4_9SPHN|nr:hypothetical protein [Sphingomonas sp. HF-S4]MDV3457783.1 hypothetical protein [Sphingomonas sp. HF-S4]
MWVPLLLLVQEAPAVTAALAEYRAKTSAEISCNSEDQDEIVVCAQREAYRHQLPLVPTYNPKNDANAQLAPIMTREAQGIVECGQGPFMAKCGSVGVGVTVGLGGAGYVRRAPPP